MNYEDRIFTCQDCGQSSTSSAYDYSLHATKTCRSKRDGRNGQSQLDLYPWNTPIVVTAPRPISNSG
jgi:hypothetical protein